MSAVPRAAIRRALSTMRSDLATWEALQERYGGIEALREQIETYALLMHEGTDDE